MDYKLMMMVVLELNLYLEYYLDQISNCFTIENDINMLDHLLDNYYSKYHLHILFLLLSLRGSYPKSKSLYHLMISPALML